MTTTVFEKFSEQLETLRSQWPNPAPTDPHQGKSPHIQFKHQSSRVFTPKECRELENAILEYIFTNTHYGLETAPEVRKKETKLLKFYIEFFLWNPNRYPIDPENPIHCLIRQAGQAVMAKHSNKTSKSMR